MRVLAHIHTFNDADIIDRPIESVLRQTHPVDAILVVDNASTDDTLEQPCLNDAIILRHRENTGTSGGVHSGMRFALEHDYDWIWLLDADSVPEADALEKLLDLYSSWPQNRQEETGFLACLPYNMQDGAPLYGGVFTQSGFARASPTPAEHYYPCHVTIWSGCLYRLAAVRQIGLPNPNYVLDWGETEYGYRVMKAGYQGVIDQDAVLRHNIRGYPSLAEAAFKLGPITLRLFEFPPIRCYYTCRNSLYFALYDYDSAQGRFRLILHAVLGLARLTVNFLLRPRTRSEQIVACSRGVWHGVTGNIAARY